MGQVSRCERGPNTSGPARPSMVALLTVTAWSQAISALSMGVFERTREIGILRCLGGRARPWAKLTVRNARRSAA